MKLWKCFKMEMCLLFAAVVLSMVLVGPERADAVEILPTDVSSPKDDCVFLGVEGKYITEIQAALDLINGYRYEACSEGVRNPDSSTGQPLTMDDYVPIKWSSDLEFIARIRAAEATITIDHARLNGKTIWFSSPGGISSTGEVLAWNGGTTMTMGVKQWYEEKDDWVNSKAGAVTGHYTSMISPSNRYVGLATFYSGVGMYRNSTAGEFSRRSSLDETRGSGTDNIIQTLEVSKSLVQGYGIAADSDGNLRFTAIIPKYNFYGNVIGEIGLIVFENATWSSSDTSVATVAADGKLTIHKCGNTVITATTSSYGTVTQELSIEHTYGKWTETTKADCNHEGVQTRTCSICGDEQTKSTPKTNHRYGNWVTTTKADCNHEGVQTRTCSICGDELTKAISKTSHSYGNWVTTTKASCKQEGVQTKTCSICGDQQTKTTAKTDHSYGKWYVKKAATTSAEGIEARDCSVCEKSETRTLPKLNSGNTGTGTGSGTGNETGNESGTGNETGTGNGNGTGNETGNGNGTGNGSGTGNGNETGTGNGNGTGTGIEAGTEGESGTESATGSESETETETGAGIEDDSEPDSEITSESSDLESSASESSDADHKPGATGSETDLSGEKKNIPIVALAVAAGAGVALLAGGAGIIVHIRKKH